MNLCDKKFGAVLEDRLAIILNLKFVGGNPVWRHQPTLAERFLEEWLALSKGQGVADYQFQQNEIRELMAVTQTMRLREMEDLLARAEDWLLEENEETTLMRFLCHVQGKPVPVANVEWQVADQPETGDDEEALFASDVWEQSEQNPAKPKPEPIVQPDSGPDSLMATLARLKAIEDSRPDRRGRRSR